MTSWFSNVRAQKEGWRLDIVSLLAVIGEGAMEAHMQPMTSHWSCILPRIMPAPQALLKPSRPTRMPQLPAEVVGVSSGTLVHTLNFFPNIIHPIDELPAFAFRLYEIKHRAAVDAPLVRTHSPSSGKSNSSGAELGAVEAQLPCTLRKRESTFRGIQKAVTKRLLTDTPHIPTQKYSPLNILSIASCLLTIGLLVLAVFFQDGTACIALGSISLASCIVGCASWWSPILKQRVFNGYVPDGDVVIRTREGAFIVVRCNEEVARELYTGTEECHYQTNTKTYRVLVGLGTFLLMASIVLLGNCDFPMQAAIGGSYITLNGAFWLTSLMNKKHFWDLSIYEYPDITPLDAKDAEKSPPGEEDDQERIASYTRTLWFAIRETKGETAWVTKSGAVPATPQWDAWLKEAGEAAKNEGMRNWNAVTRRGILIGQADPSIISKNPDRSESKSDLAKQAAPATVVPSPATR